MKTKKIVSRIIKGAGSVACAHGAFLCYVIGMQPDIIDSGKYFYLGSAAALASASALLAKSAVMPSKNESE